jgi:hypothetical protein
VGNHVEREVGSAFKEGITVIPFRIGNTKPTGVLDYYLQLVQWIDAFTPPLAEHCKSLAIKVKEVILDTKPELAKLHPNEDFSRIAGRVEVIADRC